MNFKPHLFKDNGVFISFTRKDRGVQSQSYMEENLERCVKCGKQQGLQGVSITIGRRTFHLFYLCAECGNVDIEELLMIIGLYKEKRKT